jgi:hypothetical protein
MKLDLQFSPGFRTNKNDFDHNQGCQTAYFRTKNPDLGKFWRVLQWKVLVYCVSIWSIFGYLVGIFSGHLAYLRLIGLSFSVLVCCTNKNLATLIAMCNKAERTVQKSGFSKKMQFYVSV